MRLCKNKTEFPVAEHLAVIRFVNVCDVEHEKSSHYVQYCEYIYFPDKQELESWIFSNKNEEFVVIRAEPKKIKTTVIVEDYDKFRKI